MTNTKHPLLAILPTIQAACTKYGVGQPRVLRALGQPYAIEVTSQSGRTFEIGLDEDIPKHPFRWGGNLVKTDADSIAEEIDDGQPARDSEGSGSWRMELAMEAGMGLGIAAYNDAMGQEVETEDEYDR